MTVREDEKDRFGNYPIKFKGYKKVSEIWEWLKNHYDGCHFVIPINTIPDDVVVDDGWTYVYFTNDIMEELATFTDYEIRKR